MTSLIRLFLLGVLLSLSVVGVVACGSDDKEPSEQEIQKILAERQAKEDKLAKEAITSLYAIMSDASQGEAGATAAKFCALMSSEAQAETINYVESESEGDERLDCETSVETLYLGPLRGTGKKTPTVIGTSTKQGFGNASIDTGKVVTTVSITKEHDGWKLAGTPDAGPSSDPDANAPAAARDSAAKGSSTLLP